MGRGYIEKSRARSGDALTAESRLAPLLSPTFLGALAVLVANDHWLKGAALLPTWLTGKLSDFAGLVVAPLLAVALLGARRRAARGACFCAVAVGFGALELSLTLAGEVERATRWLGLSWRVWPDPSDLLALGVLPLAWHALRTAPLRAPRWLEGTVGLLAIAACLATSSAYFYFESSLSLLNTTHGEIHLQLFRPATLDCDEVAADPEGSLAPGDFSLETCVALGSLEAAPLDWDWTGDETTGTPRVIPPGPERPCDAVLLRAEGLEDTVLFWSGVRKRELDRYSRVRDDDAHLVHLEKAGKRLFAAPPAAARSFAASASPAAAECPAEAP